MDVAAIGVDPFCVLRDISERVLADAVGVVTVQLEIP